MSRVINIYRQPHFRDNAHLRTHSISMTEYLTTENLEETANGLSRVLDCKTVRIVAYSSSREKSNKRSGARLKTESETGERR